MRRPMHALTGVLCLIGLVAACAGSSGISDRPVVGGLLVDADCPGEEVPTDLTVICYRLEMADASLSVVVIRATDPTGAPVLALSATALSSSTATPALSPTSNTSKRP
ncbi:MAG: hypothetical protein H8D48_00885 [Actinobacteria bacterium]|nr:hypothetical protein [Actinomycetota bacterium]